MARRSRKGPGVLEDVDVDFGEFRFDHGQEFRGIA